MAKNYYLILGVPFDARPDAIRSAFRERARLHHPDHGGPADAGAFREASEAYRVLSDPVRRAHHDRELRISIPREKETFVTRAHEPEPLISDPVPITGRPESVRPSFEALFERLTRNFSGSGRPKAEQEEPLNFELIVSPEEAERGVRVPFQVPVLTGCYACGGSGRDWLFPCSDCEGEGRLIDYRTVEVQVPSRVRDGTVIEVTLNRLGVKNMWLRVYVRVARH
jgi:DnaJ-class molecular chaperone